MAEVVNLRMARKRAKKRQQDAAADANRTAHGIAKSERQAGEARRNKAARELDQHRRDEER